MNIVLKRLETGQIEKEAMEAAGVCWSGTIGCETAKDCRAGITSTANSGSAAASSIAEVGEATAVGVKVDRHVVVAAAGEVLLVLVLVVFARDSSASTFSRSSA